MHTHQYVQHGWSPLTYAEMLTVMAVAVVVGMCLFLAAATRAKRARHSGEMQERPRPEVGAAHPARL